MQSDDELIRAVAARLPGALVRLNVWRDGAMRDVTIKLTERPLAQPTRASRVRSDLQPADQQLGGPLGIVVQSLDAGAMRRLSLPAQITGVLISDLDATGEGRSARLRRGEVVMEVNRHPVLTAGAFASATSGLKSGDPVALLIYDPITDQRLIVTIVIEGTT